MMSESYRYYAFISYSSKDVAIAKRLQKKIEWYHLPTTIREEIKRERDVEYPKRLSPVFRDMTDLQAGPLGQSLLRELEDSQYLIVICSPRSAQSNWVNRVIENFILMGRYDRIIPCVFDGEGNSKDPEKEAFPPILRRTPIFMDDLPENLKTEEGRQKNEERKARLRELMKGADELEGVSVDQEGERAARLKTIAKMLEVRPDDLIQRDKQFIRKRRINWSLAFAVLLFIAASIGWRIYDKNYRVHVDYFTYYVEHWGVPEGIFPLTEEQIKVRNEHYRIETRGGLVRRLIHANSAGTPVPVGNTEFKDSPMIAEYTYDENGMLRAQTWFYTIKPYQGVLGTQIREYDGNGNLTKDSFFDRDGKPCLSSDGYAKGTWKYDERGNKTEAAYFGIDDQPCLHKDGYAKVTWKYDERGNQTEEAYFGTDDQPCLHKDGYAKGTWKYDERGNIEEVAYFGTDDKLCLSKDGYAKGTWKYDERGNKTEAAYFGIDDQPCLHKDGYAKVTWKYDERGNQTEDAYFGTDDQPCLHKDGYAKVTLKYDERGNITEVAFWGTDDKPCLFSEGIAKATSKYDERGNETEQAYFGTDDKLCLSKDGYAKITSKYDEQNNLIKKSFFGVDGESVTLAGDDPYVGWEKEFDENGMLRAKTWFYTIKPYKGVLGTQIREYDENGNLTKDSFFDRDGKPCLSSDGYAKATSKYDERGNETEQAYFGTDDKLCLSKDGYAKITSKYDEQNNLIKKSFFGVDGESVTLAGDDPYVGWEKEFDENGMLRAQTWFYTIKPYQGVLGTQIREYDENGNLTKDSFFDRDGKPCLSSDGYAKMTWKYDERGNQTEEAYFGIDDQPCLCSDGYAKGTLKYDERGNQTEAACFGIDDQPCLCSHGFAKITLKYDERGKESEKAFWGIDGQSCPGPDGYAKSRINYDEAGNPISMDFYDERNNRLQLYINVNSVVPNMQADKVGIKEGDVFLLYDNKEFDPTGFVNYRKQETGDDPHSLIILRDGKKYEVEIKPGMLGANVSGKSVPQELLDEVKNMKAVPLNDSNPETSLPQEVETVPIY